MEEYDNKESVETRAGDFENTDYYWYGKEKVPIQKIDGKFYLLFSSKEESKIKNAFAETGVAIYDTHNIVEDLSVLVAEGKENSSAKKFTNLMAAFVEGSYEKVAPALASALY